MFGHAAPLAACAAALCNGTAIHGFELDDLLPAAIIHAGTVIIPAVLAAAQSVDASGEQLLRAIVIGYVVQGLSDLRLDTGRGAAVGRHAW